jgi:hypothetical protein
VFRAFRDAAGNQFERIFEGDMAGDTEASHWVTAFEASGHSRWVYLPAWPPVCVSGEHGGLCVTEFAALGDRWTFIMPADLPVSIVAYMVAWSSGFLAFIWIFVVGTLWW